VKLFEFLAHINSYTLFPNFFIALKIYMTMTVAPEKGVL